MLILCYVNINYVGVCCFMQSLCLTIIINKTNSTPSLNKLYIIYTVFDTTGKQLENVPWDDSNR